MKIFTHRKFEKAFQKMPTKLQDRFYQVTALYAENKDHKQLNNHPLIGKFSGYRSLNLTGDWRIIFEEIDSETIKLVNIGTHSQLYG